MEDSEIKKEVDQELKSVQSIYSVEPNQIITSIQDGVVTLKGELNSFSQKMAIEKAITQVKGVKAIVNNIKVHPLYIIKKRDEEIRNAVLFFLKWDSTIKDDRIVVKVEDGNVTLLGEVESYHQKMDAEKVISRIEGVKSVKNSLGIETEVPISEAIKIQISDSLRERVSRVADNIHVEVNNGKVILEGEVRSLAEKRDAEEAAFIYGITEVDNRLQVNYRPVLA